MKIRLKFFMSYNLFSLANKAIREKSDIINLLLASLPEIMLESVDEDNDLGYCEVLISKSSRITFTLKDKQTKSIYKKFSFLFPFKIIKSDDANSLLKWKITDKNNIELNSQLISVLQDLCKDHWFSEDINDSDEALVFYEQILDALTNVNLNATITDTNVWHLIRRLFLFEPGYLRYDFDDDEARFDPIYHPLHHLDIFFSNKVTFKIGLIKNEIESIPWHVSGFEDMLDSEMPCSILKVQTQSV